MLLLFLLLLILIIIICFYKSGSGRKKLTYALLAKNSIGLDEKRLDEILQPYMKPYTKKYGKVDLLWFELGFYEKTNHYEWTELSCVLSNKLKWGSTSKITKKNRVYEVAHDYMAKYYTDTMPLPGTVVFIKYAKGFSGNGNFVTSNEITIKEFLHPDKREHYVVQEYLTNLATFKTLKFHIRAYMLVSPTQYSLFENGFLYTSEKPYIKGDWENLAIHDTHIRRTKKNYYLKKYASKIDGAPPDIYEKLYEQMNFICKILYKAIEKDILPAENAEDGFDVLGLDFLVKDDFTVSFLEANLMPAYKSCPRGEMNFEYSDYSYTYYLWIYNLIIAPKFKLKKIEYPFTK